MKRADLKQPVLEALKAKGGSASIAEVCQYVWENYEAGLRASGNYFYTWQYELRWASDELVRAEKIEKGNPRGRWSLR